MTTTAPATRAFLPGIDHAVVLVRDLDAARDTYARLGFTLSPRGVHSAHMGSANHTIMLEEDYFELLGLLRPTESNTRWQDVLARREGLNALALRTGDADTLANDLRARGIAASDPAAFSRPVALPAGGSGEAAFRTTQIPAVADPAFALFACQHLTRETVWLPSLQAHANSAYALGAVTVAVEDPAATAAAYGAFFGGAPVKVEGGVLRVETGSAPIDFLTRKTLSARHPGLDLAELVTPGAAGLSFRVRDLWAVRDSLERSGTPFTAQAGRIAVPPAYANGVLVDFAQ